MSTDGEPNDDEAAELRARSERYAALAEQHARAAAALARKAEAEEEKRRARIAAADQEDEGFVLVKDVANPTGADPPVPPPEYCVVKISSD